MQITENCTGCGLCLKLCPTKSIAMTFDNEGFLTPQIDIATCISCNICKRKCPQNSFVISEQKPEYYSVINADDKELLNSSSGGVFIAASKYVLSLGGIVCGCIFDENMVARHSCADNIETVRKMCGSKYVQSEAFHSYPDVKSALEAGKYVLFTGTACQVAALRSYLSKDYEKLWTIDILCHGVPSPLLLKNYVEHLSRKMKARVVDISFRCKKRFGWGSEHRTKVVFEKENGDQFEYFPFMPAFFCGFFYGLNLREVCYKCKYAGSHRVSDITIGDYWGYFAKYKKKFPEGISIASVNSAKGKKLFEEISDSIRFCDKLEENEAKGSNTNFYYPTHRYTSRTGFYKGIETKKYSHFARKIMLNSECRRRILRTFLGAIKCRLIHRGN